MGLGLFESSFECIVKLFDGLRLLFLSLLVDDGANLFQGEDDTRVVLGHVSLHYIDSCKDSRDLVASGGMLAFQSLARLFKLVSSSRPEQIISHDLGAFKQFLLLGGILFHRFGLFLGCSLRVIVFGHHAIEETIKLLPKLRNDASLVF
ncbi:hypothetical protein AC579_2452 [Pseudocercospora musae]|uniref:Uncharacterized protein n=1 Tax=Pseudocercospora musae TaxID=113226 RepID=A0A139IHF9_9PEZI|nr:hypothetical protein AC579_2452 [Pseudocercospora musae]